MGKMRKRQAHEKGVVNNSGDASPLPTAVADGASTSHHQPENLAVTVLRSGSRGRSTGPRTAIGKRRSSVNALKYGIFSKDLLVGDESHQEFEDLLQGLRNDMRPEGLLEIHLIECLAMIVWRRRRVLRAEAAEIEKVPRICGTACARQKPRAECSRIWTTL